MTEAKGNYFAGVPSDRLEWREAQLASYESCLANLDKLVTLGDSLDRIRASFTARMEELKAEIAEMKEKAQNG